ncbi:hypothetical protein ALC53_05208 [Atta colombica]|uniref:Uncharacterized protein n=1 Tax=Atta colombica TaxID=520822 RepID=A0A195BHU2_9HYME|nr:hypothetical protein ALC53_05208 [Atta colombica]
MYDLVGSVPRRARLLKNVRHEDAPGYESSRNGATRIQSSTEGRIPRREKQKKKERKRRALWFMPVLWLPFLASYWGVAPGIRATRILMQQESITSEITMKDLSKSGNFSEQVRIKLPHSRMDLDRRDRKISLRERALIPGACQRFQNDGGTRHTDDDLCTYVGDKHPSLPPPCVSYAHEHGGALQEPTIAGPPEGRCRQMAGRCLQSCPDCRSGRRVYDLFGVSITDQHPWKQ